MTTAELTRRVLSLDIGDAIALIEEHGPAGADPYECYWDIVERAELDDELREDF